MKKVYESSTAVEAYMVKNLLESEGIESRVDGEYLQGGVGDLQAIGVVRLMVEDSLFQKAKEIIDQWEASQPAPDAVKPSKSSGAVNGFVLGVILTAGVAIYIFNSPVTKSGVDYDGDGFLEEEWSYRNDRVDRVKYDRNFDKKYDAIFFYDNRGLLSSAESDDNFDGVFESKIFFRLGSPVSEESDKNQNGVVDYIGTYKYGVLNSIEIIDENSGKARKRQHYELNKLISSDYDSNGDGRLDIHYEYDQFEERK